MTEREMVLSLVEAIELKWGRGKRQRPIPKELAGVYARVKNQLNDKSQGTKAPQDVRFHANGA